MESVDVLVVGGGLAGAALAYHLTAGELAAGTARPRVRVVERAPLPGAHASGRNARLLLQSVAEPVVRELTAASARAYSERADEVGFDRCGSLLLGSEAAFAPLRDPAIESTVLDADEVRARVPWIAASDFEAALLTPGDGVLDPHRLLAFYLGAARRTGVEVTFDAEVQHVEGEGPFRVRTRAGSFLAARLVNAAGAWAGELAGCTGASSLPLVAYKRHLFLQRFALPGALPYVWHLAGDVYFRGDGEGTLSCMCDEIPTSALAETVDAGVEERLRERLRVLSPEIAAAPLVRTWSCFRTKVPDALPVIGPDPRLPAFWWVAGLGGFGLGSSWEVGRLAARALLEGAETLPEALLPGRF